ncbi:MAG TPA: transposase [Acidimicrobiales bacterium]|nr:transposase [Acidimicrobiales bacterium]
MLAYGTPLVEDPDRIGEPIALGLDETLFCRVGKWRRQSWSASIVDVEAGRLLDVVPGRSGVEPCRWLAERGDAWLANIGWATLDLSGPYRAVFDTMLPDATQIADPFHVVKLANSKLDECRRRVPPPGAERDARAPWPQERPALPGPATAHQGARTPR